VKKDIKQVLREFFSIFYFYAISNRGGILSGIAGIIDCFANIKNQQQVLEEMIYAMKHRGPDGYDYWISGSAAIANNNFFLLDKQNCNQPLVKIFGDSRYVLSYNGEIYNFRELRKELEGLGHNFTTESDGEVIISAYIEYKEKCLSKFHGMFAFALWDELRQILFLARDQLGAKPLFYSCDNHKIVFASEIKGLLKHPEIEASVDNTGLSEIFTLGPGFTPGVSIFTSVIELKQGHYLYFHEGQVQVNQYFKLQAEEHTDSLNTTAEKIRYLVKNSIAHQTKLNTKYCCLLSGGLDSSAIVSLIAKERQLLKDYRIDTLSLEYEDNEKYFQNSYFQPSDDKYWIDRVSRELQTRHKVLKITYQDLFDSLEDAMIARDLPGMADIDSSLLCLFSKIRGQYRVVFSGECADEIFGGYPWYHVVPLQNNIFPWMRNIEERERILSEELKEQIDIKDYIKNRYCQAINEVPSLQNESILDKQKREINYLNITRFMDVLAIRKDRMSMANGIEARMPYCDHIMAQYLFNVPYSMKLVGGNEKGILKMALKGILPDDVIRRKKSPFPKTHHPKYEELVKLKLREILNNSSSPILPLINKKEILVMMNESSNYGMPFFGQLMSRPQLYAYLIQVNMWLEKYKVSLR